MAVTDRTEARTTVVIPVWGRYVGPVFEAALLSIMAQDVPLTVIVVDNASQVDLPPMDEPVRVVRLPERTSLGAARNAGLAQVRTETVLFADADDVMLPGTIRRLQRAFEDDPRLVAYAMAFVDAGTMERHRWPRPWIGRLVRAPRLLALVNAVWAVYPITGPVLLRTEVVREVGGHGDLDNGDARCLGASLLFRGPVGWSEEPGWVYHQRRGSNLDRFSGTRALLESSRSVRERLWNDVTGPPWVRRMLPLIAAAQWSAVTVHLLKATFRRVVRALAASGER